MKDHQGCVRISGSLRDKIVAGPLRIFIQIVPDTCKDARILSFMDP